MITYIHYGHTTYDKDLFTPIRNRFYSSTKPDGGLWASRINTEYSWKQWCENENFRDCDENDSFNFSLKENTKVLYINNISDLKNLPIKEDEYSIPSWVCLDFEKLMELGYDAVELSISNDFNLYFALYGWDCDSILIMNKDCIEVL